MKKMNKGGGSSNFMIFIQSKSKAQIGSLTEASNKFHLSTTHDLTALNSLTRATAKRTIC